MSVRRRLRKRRALAQLREVLRRPCRRASAGSGRGAPGSARSRSKIAPNVWRLAIRKTQNALIIMCRSTASMSRVKLPSARPRSRIALDQLDRRAVLAGEVLAAGEVLGAVDVLDADQADEVGVRLVVVEGQLGEPADRGDGVEVVDVDRLLGGADVRVGALEHGHEQPLLAAEVVVDHPLRGAGALGDLVDARAGEPVLGELLAWRPRGSPAGCGRRRGSSGAVDHPRHRTWAFPARASWADNVLVRTLDGRGAIERRQHGTWSA